MVSYSALEPNAVYEGMGISKFDIEGRLVGWKLDYFFVNEEFKESVKRSTIMSDVMGSDHCIICLEFEI